MALFTTMPARPRPTRSVDDFVNAVMGAGAAMVEVTSEVLGQLAPELALGDLQVLAVLARDGAKRLGDIAELLDVTPTTATRVADRLTHAGLVDRVRTPADRREVYLEVTQSGRSVVADTFARRREVVADLISGVSAADRAAAGRLLDRINQRSGRRAKIA